MTVDYRVLPAVRLTEYARSCHAPGNGGLGLRKAEPGEEIVLGPAPVIDEFEQIEAEAIRRRDQIDWRDLLARVLGN